MSDISAVPLTSDDAAWGSVDSGSVIPVSVISAVGLGP
jgi:hypothetical protein